MNLTEAAEFAARWADTQRGMVAFADAVQHLGAMENATAERQAALEAATKAHEAKVAELEDARSQLESLRQEHAATIDTHLRRLADTISFLFHLTNPLRQ